MSKDKKSTEKTLGEKYVNIAYWISGIVNMVFLFCIMKLTSPLEPIIHAQIAVLLYGIIILTKENQTDWLIIRKSLKDGESK